MAWLNTILSLFAFSVGFCLLLTYPYYRGIDSSLEVILTPLGLVFVLEIDNWMYEIAKHCYPESTMDQLWTFRSAIFREKPYFERVSEVGNAVAILYYIVINVCLVVIVWIVSDQIHIDVIAGHSVNIPQRMGLVPIIAIILGFIGVFVIFQCCACWFCFKRKLIDTYDIVYDDEALDKKIDRGIMIEIKELNVGNMQKSKSNGYTSIDEEEDSQQQVLDQTMNEVLRMASVNDDHDNETDRNDEETNETQR